MANGVRHLMRLKEENRCTIYSDRSGKSTKNMFLMHLIVLYVDVACVVNKALKSNSMKK